MHILVLEASTTSAKALLYDTDTGRFREKSRPYTGNYEDVTIHKVENVYAQMTALGRELADGENVDIIALSGTWHSIALFDRAMQPLTPIFLWSYTGAADVCREYRQDERYVREYYNRTGCMVNAVYPFFKLKLLSRDFRLGDCLIMGQGSYNNYRLTGQRVTTGCLVSGSGLLNIHTKQYDPQALAELGIREEQLSRVTDYRETLPLTDEAAKALGVKSGIPVVLCNSDGGLNQVGSGAVRKGIATFSVGTSGAIRLTTDAPRLPEKPSTWCYLSPVGWLSGAATNGCCNCIDWFKKAAFGEGVSYREIEESIGDKEDTPVFLPFVFGERCPGWNDERSGGFRGLLPHHDRGDMYRAVQEGVLFNLYQCYRALSETNGEPEHIRFSGGILRSGTWTQMCADIFRRPLEVDSNEHASMMGAAVLAMEKLGVIPDARTYTPAAERVVLPDAAKADRYAAKYERYCRYYNEMTD